MQEKPLKNRKRKRPDPGRPIRISPLVLSYLNERRMNRRKLSFDAYLRIVLGLPRRQEEKEWVKGGRPKLLVEGWVEQISGQFFFDQAEANGRMVLELAKARSKKAVKPIRMREIV